MSEHPATIPPKPAPLNTALLILRLACALAFLYHGSAILFGALRGPGPERFSAFMHMPRVIGYLVGLAQFAGGLAMLLGVLVRLAAACLIVVMLGAIFLVHLPHGFDVGKGGLEYALTQFADRVRPPPHRRGVIIPWRPGSPGGCASCSSLIAEQSARCGTAGL